MKTLRSYHPQMDRAQEDAYYDREDAAILELQARGWKLTDRDCGPLAKLDGVELFESNWQGCLRRARELAA